MIRFLLIQLFLGFFGFLSSQESTSIRLVDFEPSECQDEYHVYKLNNRIVSLENYGDTTIVEISMRANCCLTLNPKISVQHDTINLIFDYYEPELVIENGDTFLIIQEECNCDCCYSFRYFLTGLNDDNYVYISNNEILEFSNHKYNVIQEPKFNIADSDTLNYVDIYGMRQGLHKIYDKHNREIRSMIYQDDLPINGLWFRTYSDLGIIEQERYWISDTLFRVLLFDTNGTAIKECHTSDLFDIDERECMNIE